MPYLLLLKKGQNLNYRLLQNRVALYGFLKNKTNLHLYLHLSQSIFPPCQLDHSGGTRLVAYVQQSSAQVQQVGHDNFLIWDGIRHI